MIEYIDTIIWAAQNRPLEFLFGVFLVGALVWLVSA